MPRSILFRSTWARLRQRKEEMIEKTKAAVQDRLTKEINYWDHRAAQLKDQELAGKNQREAQFRAGPATGRRPDRPASKAACRA